MNGDGLDQRPSDRAVFYFFLILFGISVWLAGKLIAPFYPIVILGFVATSIFAPFYRFALIRLKPIHASFLTCFIIFLTVLVPAIFFVGILSKEAYDLYVAAKNAVLSNQLRQLLENTHMLEKLNEILASMGFDIRYTWEELIAPVTELGKLVGFSLFQQASFVASNLLKFIFYFCLMLIVVFYLLRDSKRLVDYIYDLSPLPDEHNDKLFAKFKEMGGAVLIGNGLGGLIQGTIGGLMFFFLGLNSPFLWGLIMGFLAFLPIVGIGMVFLPLSVFFLLKKKIALAVFTIVFYGVLSWGIEYIFKPKVVGDRVSMHPLIVFFAILGGLQLYGILGIIYGPLIVTLFLTLAEIYFSTFQILVEPDRVKLIKKDCE